MSRLEILLYHINNKWALYPFIREVRVTAWWLPDNCAQPKNNCQNQPADSSFTIYLLNAHYKGLVFPTLFLLISANLFQFGLNEHWSKKGKLNYWWDFELRIAPSNMHDSVICHYLEMFCNLMSQQAEKHWYNAYTLRFLL